MILDVHLLHVSAVGVPVRSLQSVAVSLSGVLSGSVVSGAGTGPTPAVAPSLSLPAVPPAPAPGAPGAPGIPPLPVHTVSSWTGVASVSGRRGLVPVRPVTMVTMSTTAGLRQRRSPSEENCFMMIRREWLCQVS